MKLLDRVWNRIAHTERVKEILAPEFSMASGGSIDSDDYKYRRLSQTRRDLEPYEHERAINISFWLHETNQFYKRIVDLSHEAIEDAGIVMKSEDDTINELWNEFWEKPITGFKNNFFDLWADVKKSGELIYPVGVNAINGDIELGFIEPLNVKNISLVPGNALQADKIQLKDNAQTGEQGKVFDVIRMVGGRLRGNCFHYALNKPVNSSRGRPLFMALTDWIDLHDQNMFNEMERWSMLRSFVWHSVMEGANEKEIKDFMIKHFPGGQPPNPGSVLVTNEKVELNAVQPDIKAQDGTQVSNMSRRNILGGVGYPDHFFAYGNETNVATAREQMKPVIWKIGKEQRTIVKILTMMFVYKLEMASTKGKQLKNGKIQNTEDWQISCNPIFERDRVQDATTLQQITNSLAVAKMQKFIDTTTARKIYINILKEQGHEEIKLQEIEQNLGNEETDAANIENEISNKMDAKLNKLARKNKPSFAELEKM